MSSVPYSPVESDSEVAWSPDGGQIAFGSHKRLFVEPASGGEAGK